MCVQSRVHHRCRPPASQPQQDASDATAAHHAQPAYSRPRRGPLDNEYIMGLVQLQRRHLLIASAALFACTVSAKHCMITYGSSSLESAIAKASARRRCCGVSGVAGHRPVADRRHSVVAGAFDFVGASWPPPKAARTAPGAAAFSLLADAWPAMLQACNLASPVITGFLFEMLAGRGRDISQYPAFFATFAGIYVAEPLLTRVYIRRVCYAAENVRCSADMSHSRPAACSEHVSGRSTRQVCLGAASDAARSRCQIQGFRGH